MVVAANLVFKKVMVHAFASFQEHPDGHQIHGEHVLHGEDQVEYDCIQYQKEDCGEFGTSHSNHLLNQILISGYIA